MAAGSDRAPSRTGLFIPFAALLGAMVLHAAYWAYAAGQIEQRALTWIEAQEAAGYTVEHQGMRVGGYPFRFSLQAQAPRLAAPAQEGGWTVGVERLAASAQFYDLSHWIVTLDGRGEVVADGQSYQMIADRARLSFRARDGATHQIGASIETLAISGPEGQEPAVRAVDQLALSGFVGEEDQLALRVQLNGVTLGSHVAAPDISAQFGETISLARMDMVVSQWSALARIADPEEWRRAEGELIVSQAQLIWGPAELSGDGRIGLDPQLLPQGRLSVVVTDPETLIAALEGAGLVHDEQGQALRLAAIMAPRREGGIALPFRLSDGGVFLGPARIGDIAGAQDG